MKCRFCDAKNNNFEIVDTFQKVSLLSNMKKCDVGYDLVICKNCGSLQNITDKGFDFSNYYQNDYSLLTSSYEEEELFFDEKGESIYKSDRLFKYFDDFVQDLSNGKFLDVGCGKGLALRLFTKKYPQWDAYGFDLSIEYLSHLEKVIPRQNIILSNPEILKEYQGCFDLVAAFDVIEHVQGPIDFLSNLNLLLRIGGHAYIQVPDIEYGEFDWLILDHVSHINIELLIKFSEGFGFKIKRYSNNNFKGSIQLIMEKVEQFKSYKNISLNNNFYQKNKKNIDMHRSYYYQNFVPSVKKCFDENEKVCIFGTGTAASVITTYIDIDQDKLCSFIDGNKHRIGRTHHGKSVIAINEVPEDVGSIFLGVSKYNVNVAREFFKDSNKMLYFGISQ